MELWGELFSDWVGILSFGVLVFILLMGVWFARYFLINSGEQDKQE